MPSLPVRPRQITVAGALATAVALAGAGLSAAAPSAPDDKVQVVPVTAPGRKERSGVDALGLDTTEHGDSDGRRRGAARRGRRPELRAAGFSWRVKVADLAATRRAAAADRAYAASVASRPSRAAAPPTATSTTYNRELARLARKYPKVVRPSPSPTAPCSASRSAASRSPGTPTASRDGKPVFLMMGAHHAREWPSAEHAMEFAYDLLQNVRASAARRRGSSRGRAHDRRADRQRRRLPDLAATPTPLGDFSARSTTR